MPVTYKKIASVTVGAGGAATIDFTSIPSTYTDLILKVSHRGTSNTGVAGLELQYNGSTSSLTFRRLIGDGASASSGTASTGQVALVQGGNATADTFGNLEVYIPNYAGSTNKSASADNANENNATTEYLGITAHLWSNTAAITSIKLDPNAGDFVQHSTATLYGISKS